jgi:hypothetical protein
MDIRAFPVFPQDRDAVLTAAAIRGATLAIPQLC